MCLDYLLDESLPEAMIGYKRVIRPAGFGTFAEKPICAPATYRLPPGWHPAVPLERGFGWAMRDKQRPIFVECGDERYFPGVHAWTDDPAARRSGWPPNLVRVLLRGPLAIGMQDGFKVVVYREMTILEAL